MAASNNGLILSAICFTRAKVLIFFQITVATPQKNFSASHCTAAVAVWRRGSGGSPFRQKRFAETAETEYNNG